MSNIFTRKRYDPQEHRAHVGANQKFNNHLMDINPHENKNGCVHSYIPSQGQGQISRPLNNEGFLNFADQTDIESRLRNQHLELNSQKRTNTDYQGFSRNDIQTCDSFGNVLNEDSRFSNPISNYREMSPQSRGVQFTPYLHMNPQNVHANNDNKMTTYSLFHS